MQFNRSGWPPIKKLELTEIVMIKLEQTLKIQKEQ